MTLEDFKLRLSELLGEATSSGLSVPEVVDEVDLQATALADTVADQFLGDPS